MTIQPRNNTLELKLINLPYRFTNVKRPCRKLPNELWFYIFSMASAQEMSVAQQANKFFYNLFWNTRQIYNLKNLSLVKAFSILKKANPKAVREIHMPSGTIVDKDINWLCSMNFESLQVLDFTDASIKNDDLNMITKAFSKLKFLNLTCCREITDKGLCHLSRLDSLEVLQLDGLPKITEVALRSISYLTNLKQLQTSSSPTSLLALDSGFGIEVNRSKLVSLRNLVSDCGFSQLVPLNKLMHLDTGPFMSPTPLSIELLQNLTNLQTLTFGQCQLLDDASIDRISTMKSLTSLNLCKVQFVSNLHLLGNMTQLRNLSLRASIITDEILKTFAKLPYLLTLDVSLCHRLTLPGLLKFQMEAEDQSLRSIVVMNCRGIYQNTNDSPMIRVERKGNKAPWEPIYS